MAKNQNLVPAEKAAELHQRAQDRQLTLLRKALAEEADNGKCCLLLNQTLSEESVAWLKKNGYRVKHEFITRFTSVYW